jgi:predicted enzyme related to lactoylglutathione lyase
MNEKKALFRTIDCLRIPVNDLDAALKFYKESLGHQLIWRTKTSAGLRFPESESEIVIHTEPDDFEVDLTVHSVEEAVEIFVNAGGYLIKGPFNIRIGKCGVVKDPWGNQLVFLDNSIGLLKTDKEGNVIGTTPKIL